MMTEWQECMQYLHFPDYECDDPQDHRYMSGFHFGMFKKMIGFGRILTLIARRYLFHTETGEIASGDPYTRIEYARRALLAWCSFSTGRNVPITDSTVFGMTDPTHSISRLISPFRIDRKLNS